jgi:hypothetical protein
LNAGGQICWVVVTGAESMFSCCLIRLLYIPPAANPATLKTAVLPQARATEEETTEEGGVYVNSAKTCIERNKS